MGLRNRLQWLYFFTWTGALNDTTAYLPHAKEAGKKDQCENGADTHATNDNGSETSIDYAASAGHQQQRQHAKNAGERAHEDGA